MKKKIIISGVVVISIIVVAVIVLTNMFTKGVITGKLYRVDNVYEEIWNMVNSEKNGIQTVLTTSIEGSEVDYDLGCFAHISIPLNEEYRVILSFYQNELCIWLFEKNGKSYDSACYVFTEYPLSHK